MRIDAHQHFWQLKARAGQWPPPELEAIYRDFGPADLTPLLSEAGMDGTVLVQTMESTADTDFMLDLAETTPFVKGVVGWVDLAAPDAGEQIAARAANPLFKGLRPMLQDLEDDGWILRPELRPALESLVAHDLAFDALVKPRHFGSILDLVERHPDLRMVIDHGGKPEIGEGRFVGWRKAMADLAAHPGVHCKLSGLPVEAGDQKSEAMRPYIETILDLFGPARVLWGSDWPVVRLASDYLAWLRLCEAIVPEEYHGAVFGDNAIAFYRLNGSGA